MESVTNNGGQNEHTYIHTRFRKLILPCLFAGAVLISSGTAFGSLSPFYTDSLGRQWADPFSADLLNKDYNTQFNAFSADGYTFATSNTIMASVSADGYLATLPGLTQWLTDKFFSPNNPSASGIPCFSNKGCNLRYNNLVFTGFHGGWEAGLSAYVNQNYGDSDTGNADFGLGALGFKVSTPPPTTTPEPSMIGLLGTSLMLMGLAAYRRKQN